MKPFPPENPDQKEIRGLERTMESSVNGTRRLRIDQERALADRIKAIKERILTSSTV